MLLADLVPEQVPRSLVSLAGRLSSSTSRLSRHTKSPNPRRITDGLGIAERPNLAHISFHSVELLACLLACCPYHSAAFRCFAFTTDDDDHHHHHCRLEPTSDPLSGPSIHYPVHGHGHPASRPLPRFRSLHYSSIFRTPNSGIRSPTTSSPPSFGRPKTGHGPNHLKKGSLRDWGPERDCVRETLTGYKAGRQESLFGGVQLGN
ncbi:hypothetical protein NEUTE2DRAFT_114016 [Neurospora tetrasperma FGSC 2509]|nr:hypothetical protein NEUTE2DRAFT_114016 [Neurospora tetrasperma FGSC 2509]